VKKKMSSIFIKLTKKAVPAKAHCTKKLSLQEATSTGGTAIPQGITIGWGIAVPDARAGQQ
jgi:hypothetical protein